MTAALVSGQLRAHLTMVITLTIALLAIFGLLLSLVVPAFPWALGLGTGALTFLLLGLVMRVRSVRRWLAMQWHATRQPVTALTSVALTVLVLLTTGFASQPSLVAQGQLKPSGYDFSYAYHQPTHTGGSITVGWAQSLETLAPNWMGSGISWFTTSPIFQSCIVQLPDQSLGLAGWKADQCTEVPSVDNSGDSADEKTTIIHIDPRAVWSDGVPLTATDFLFGQQLGADPNLTGDGLPFALMTLKPLDAHTIQIRWATTYPDYLTALGYLFPVPLHVYATGKFAGVFNPVTRAYNSALAQQLVKTPAMNTAIPVDNGPFTLQSFTPNHQVVLVRNPRFFSNFFHAPALDKITIVPAAGDFLPQLAAGLNPVPQMEDDAIKRYQQGALDLAVSLTPVNLRQAGNIPRGQVIVGSASDTIELAFNQQTIAPNAHGNGSVSIFTDRKVRQAFIEAFDRCAAVRALLGDVRCDDPNVFTDESDATAAVAAFDPTFRLPAYTPQMPGSCWMRQAIMWLMASGAIRMVYIRSGLNS